MKRIALIASALAVLAGCGDFDSSSRRSHLKEIADELRAAYERFHARDFDGCIAMCHLILANDPGYTVAQELANDARTLKERENALGELVDILVAAIDCFESRDFDGCMAYCNWGLSREPDNVVAERLTEYVAAVREWEEHYEPLRDRVCEWRKSIKGKSTPQ
ncbi:MAG TPA: hypothetical protein VFS19_06895 [Planctomycetota bacterium]|nr:hypothetical protein [Planctomycetota bacterium]